MKRLVFLFVLATLVPRLSAQESPDTLWKFNGLASLNFSQLSLTNWAAGGENSVAGNAIVNLSANYLNEASKVSWTNDLIMGYGLLKQGETPVRKSDDKIDFASKFGYRASKKWYYSGLLSFKTQFDIGYDKPAEETRKKISNFMSPGYLNLSLGMDFKPNDEFTILLSPVTGKMTLVLDDDLSTAGAFGVDPGKQIRGEFGGFIKIAYAKAFSDLITLKTKIDLFSNYLENPQYIDINFDFLVNFKLTEYISASFVSQAIYDRDILFEFDDNDDGIAEGTEPRVQFKQLFGLGLTYSF
jgi:hypothetical protein